MIPPFHPHYEVWAVVFVLGFGYWYTNSRIRIDIAPDAVPPTTIQWWQWYAALGLLWLVSDWPFHDIGEQSLFTIHMVEHIVLALVVPPMLLMGLPRWLADTTLGRAGVARVLRPLCRAVPAFAVYNTVLLTLHWPDAVELMVTDSRFHFLAHLILFGAACLVWMPVLSPTAAIPKLSRPMQMLYLFLLTLLPTVPASFLTFSSVPLYPVYGDAATLWGLTPVADQTIAGVIMKLGGGFLLWGTIAVIWFRWTTEERNRDELTPSRP